LCFAIIYFNHRNWEALTLKTTIPHYGPFYPSREISSIEEGDLAYHTDFAVKKSVVWKTDQYGFRNDSVINSPDVVVIGDSFINGTGMSQENTFVNQLSKKTRLKVYGLAPFTFTNWVNLVETGVIKKPKQLIFSCAEKVIPEVYDARVNNFSKKEQIKTWIKKSNIAIPIDRFFRFYILEWLRAKINHSHGIGIQSSVFKKMFFLKGQKIHKRSNKELMNMVDAIVSYKEYCNSHQIKFLFLPMPNKESVYFDLVPLKDQPDYLIKLDSILKNKNICSVNSLSVFNKNRKANNFLYHLDDTHWNEDGVKIIVEEVAKLLKPNEEGK